MVGPRPRVLLTQPLTVGTYKDVTMLDVHPLVCVRSAARVWCRKGSERIVTPVHFTEAVRGIWRCKVGLFFNLTLDGGEWKSFRARKHVVATGKGKTVTISAFAVGKPRKTCAEMAGRRTFRLLTSSQPSGSCYYRTKINGHTHVLSLTPFLWVNI
jgi:hypothetical protein